MYIHTRGIVFLWYNESHQTWSWHIGPWIYVSPEWFGKEMLLTQLNLLRATVMEKNIPKLINYPYIEIISTYVYNYIYI